MKKALLAVLLVAASTAAMAQSSVTLYGLLDAGVNYTSNEGGSHSFASTAGLVDESYFGFKGSEDLGGGLKAVFALEEGFNLGTGQNSFDNELFSRQAYVGLASDKYGALTFGRQWDAFSDVLAPIALTGTDFGGAIAAHPFDNDNLNQTFSVANSVKYQTPEVAGLQGEAQYGFSNGSASRSYSVGVTYKLANLTAAAGYLNVNSSGSDLAGALGNEATFTAGKQETWGAGVSYAFDKATVGALVTQTRLSSANAANFAILPISGFARFTNYEVNTSYNVTPALTLSGAYTFTEAHLNATDTKYNQVTAQASYALSKRTNVYLEGVYQRANGDHAVAVINDLAPSSTGSQAVVTTGIIHRF